MPKIHPELFPAKPVFATSNKSHRKVNAKAVSKALELALKGDLRELEAMDLPPSPKLRAWHSALARELTHQLEAPPERPGCVIQQAKGYTNPPTASSYWVSPGLFLAGAYPGDSDSANHQKKIHAILDAGIRVFISLMEKDERNHQGKPFVPYQGLAKEYCSDCDCLQFPIRDLTAPSAAEMTTILDTIDERLAFNTPVYLHCWGGVGRTGTVVACWLLRHGIANHGDVLQVLSKLREQDQERGGRTSPESDEQRDFVLTWPPESVSQPNDGSFHSDHWSQNRSWTDALERYQRLRKEGRSEMILDLDAIDDTVFSGGGPAYKLMDAMVSVWKYEGEEGYRGAPRILLALLSQLDELSRRYSRGRLPADQSSH